MAASFALRSVSTTIQVLPRLSNDLSNLELRTRMLEASLLGGMAIASTKTTLSHSISYPITLRFGVLHGLACAFTIVQVLQFNAERDDGPLGNIAQSLGYGTVGSFSRHLEDLLAQTGALSWLANLVPSKDDLLALAPQAITPGRADNNPRPATVSDIETIMAAAWDRAQQSVGPTSAGQLVHR